MSIQGIGAGAGGFGNVAANAMLDNAQSKATDSIKSILDGNGPTTEQEIEEAATQMESLFASMLVKELRGSMTNGLFGDGPGADIYNEWFDKHIGDAIAEDGGLGMAGMLKVQLGIEAAIEARELKDSAEGEEPGEASGLDAGQGAQ